MKSIAIKIESDVPVPEHRSYRRSPRKTDVLKDMEVGNSVFFHGMTGAQFSGSMTWQKLRNGKRFITRTMDGGVRIWRTK